MSTVPQNLNHAELAKPKAKSRAGVAPWILVLVLCCVVATGISGYLTWTTLTSSKIAGCGGGVFDCSHVTNSKWSMWMGLPVSALAIGSYLSLATALAFAVLHKSPEVKRFAWTAVSMFALSAGLAAIWFTGLQAFVLEHYCSWCLTAHACGITAAAIAIWKIPNRSNVMKFSAPMASAGIAVLMLGQIYQAEPEKFRIETFEAAPENSEVIEAPTEAIFEAPSDSATANVTATHNTPVAISSANVLISQLPIQKIASVFHNATAMFAFTSPLQSGSSAGSGVKSGSDAKAGVNKTAANAISKERRTVGIIGGTTKLDISQWPLNGSTDAKYIFVEMLDYNCPNCRRTHKAIANAKRMLNEDVAVLILPIPLNTACNTAVTKTDAIFVESCDIAKLAIALWRVAPEKFSQFHEAMFANEKAPTLAQATEMAKSMADGAKIDAEIASGVPGKYISSMVQLYERSGKGGVPKLMFPTTSIVGEFTSAESLVDVIRQQTR